MEKARALLKDPEPGGRSGKNIWDIVIMLIFSGV